jgi:glycosyltransferase involved in cell wall biosynthesis
MLFTIAIPTYNNQDTISKAIESALAQAGDIDYEILIVNNNSSDRTATHISKYVPSSKIHLVNNNKTVTMWENHNVCLESAKGDYVIFCHADDQLLPECLLKFNGVLRKRNFPQKYICWGRSEFRDYLINWNYGDKQLNEIYSGLTVLDGLQVGGITPSGTCYSKSTFKELGGFLTSSHKLAPSDMTSLWKMCLLGFNFEMLDFKLFVREFASTANNFTRKNKIESIRNAFKQLFKDLSKEQKNKLKKYLKECKIIRVITFRILYEGGYISKVDLLKQLIKQWFTKDRKYFILDKKEYLKTFFYVLTH